MSARGLGLAGLVSAGFAALWLTGPREFLSLAIFIVGMAMVLTHRLQGFQLFAKAAGRGTLRGLSEGAAQKVYFAIGAGLVGFALLGTVLK